MKLISSLVITICAFSYYSQTSCFSGKDDVMKYVIYKTFESSDGKIKLTFNPSQAELQTGSSKYSYMYENFSYLGSGYKGSISMTNLSTGNVLKMYVSCIEKMMTDNQGTLLYEKSTSNQSSSSNNEKIVNLGWMTENLNVDKFRNGDPIPEAKTAEEWSNAKDNKQPVWCYYDNDPSNGTKYGKLYNWYAVNDPRGLAPNGYHIPTFEEWGKLIAYLGGEDTAAKKMKSTSGWKDNGNGTNSSGFSGLPGGFRGFNGTFYDVGVYGYWWSSSESNTGFAWYRFLDYLDGSVGSYDGTKGRWLSVRCLRD
jgi:uncharacterized protein (TIGR02145 family)